MARSGFWRSFGPGLVWAATAIGVSHLVQSTRAGASYGFALVWVVLLANLLKYPFFEFGPRYAAATGESLVEGYRRQGRWTVWAYLFLTLGTMFAVQGAVTFVTGALATQVFGDALSPFGYSAALLALIAGLLVIGRYPVLDALVKGIIVVLTVSTVAAVVLAWLGYQPPEVPVEVEIWDAAGLAFLIALVGWMPSAIDISVWHSLWTIERSRQTGHRPQLREALLDFNIGYFGTACLALAFLSLGALTVFGRGQELDPRGGAFAVQLIGMYTEALGPWARWIILSAALTTMFSTTLTVTDAFPRVLARTSAILNPKWAGAGSTLRLYWAWMAIAGAGSLLLIGALQGSLTRMVDIATTLSFLTAPVLGWFNYRAVTADHVPVEARPPLWLRVLSWIGIVFGVVFGAAFLVWRFA